MLNVVVVFVVLEVLNVVVVDLLVLNVVVVDLVVLVDLEVDLLVDLLVPVFQKSIRDQKFLIKLYFMVADSYRSHPHNLLILYLKLLQYNLL